MAPPTTTSERPTAAALVARWALPALWALLPFLAGPAFADALDGRSRAVQLVASSGLWLAWGAALAALVVPRTTTLTFVRIVVPASVVASAGAALAAPVLGVAAAVAVGSSLAVTILVLAAPTGERFVNGSSYGDEKRMPLRPPAALLLGPVQLAWVVCLGGAITGPLLLATESWVAGGIALVVGWPSAFVAGRALHGLSTRWVVFVPAGFVLHDLMAVTDPLLMPRRMIARLGPAEVGTTATDLTLGAYGLALSVELTEATPIAPVPRRTRPGQRPAAETTSVAALLFTPSRPGAVLREADARRIAVS